MQLLKYPQDAVPLNSDELQELSNMIAHHRREATAAKGQGGRCFGAAEHTFMADKLCALRDRAIAQRN